MNELEYMRTRSQEAVVSTNKVLRNTYWLLSMTLLFSAATAGLTTAMGIGHGTGLIFFLIGFGSLFWVNKVADTSQGLLAVFAFTGCMGAALGPMLNQYLALTNGPALIMQALGGTALIFLTLSGYVLTSRKDFSFMGGFLMTGLVIMFVSGLVLMFVDMPLMSIVWSAAIVLLMSGLILFDTSRIIHGGETNYIRATVSLYLNVYNLFVNLLHLLGVAGGDE